MLLASNLLQDTQAQTTMDNMLHSKACNCCNFHTLLSKRQSPIWLDSHGCCGCEQDPVSSPLLSPSLQMQRSRQCFSPDAVHKALILQHLPARGPVVNDNLVGGPVNCLSRLDSLQDADGLKYHLNGCRQHTTKHKDTGMVSVVWPMVAVVVRDPLHASVSHWGCVTVCETCSLTAHKHSLHGYQYSYLARTV